VKIVRKTQEFNHGTPLPFELIKLNRAQATKEMAEGNTGLYKLLNTCIDNDIPTLSCCGDVKPMIAIECNEDNKKLLYSLWSYLETLYQIGTIKCSIKLNHSFLADRFLSIHIRNIQESSRVFYLIEQFIRDPIYLKDYTLYEQLDAIIEKLSFTYQMAVIGDAHHEKDMWKYILEVENRKNVFKTTPKSLKTDSTYLKSESLKIGYRYYGLNSDKEITNLMYSLYDGLHRLTKSYPELEKIVYKLEKIKK